MTYRELFYKATRLIDKGEITLGEYDEMTKPLNREIEQQSCDDAISREAVCNIVNDIRDCISVEGYCAIIERLKKLPHVTPTCEEREKGECRIMQDDLISRQAVLDAINNNRFRYTVAKEDACTGNVLWDSDLIDSNVVQDISNLPSVTPKSETVTDFADRCRECGARYGKLLKQKYGKWIKHPEIETSTPEYLMFYECSECGDKQCFCKSDLHKKRFCNSCGVKMQESEE